MTSYSWEPENKTPVATAGTGTDDVNASSNATYYYTNNIMPSKQIKLASDKNT